MPCRLGARSSIYLGIWRGMFSWDLGIVRKVWANGHVTCWDTIGRQDTWGWAVFWFEKLDLAGWRWM